MDESSKLEVHIGLPGPVLPNSGQVTVGALVLVTNGKAPGCLGSDFRKPDPPMLAQKM